MNLCNTSCLSDGLAIVCLHLAVCRAWLNMQTFQPDMFIPAMVIGTNDFYHFIQLPVTLTYAVGSQSQHEAKPVGFIFSIQFSFEEDETSYGDEAIQPNFLILVLNESYWTRGSNLCFTDCIKKTKNTCNVGMHSEIYIQKWFKLGLMINTTELHIIMLVCVTLTLIQGRGMQERKKLLCQLSPMVINGLRWNCACCWDLLV